MTGEKQLSGLEALERSDAGFIELIEHAVRILGVDLLRTAQSVQSRQDSAPTDTIYTFKEQWILRWFIRYLAAADSKQANILDSGRPSAELLDWRPWALLLHLMNTVSSSAILEIFLERKFLPRLVTAFQRYADNISVEDSSTPTTDPARNEVERAPKRRRLSPATGSDPDLGQTSAALLAICARCADLSATGDVAGHDPSATLWSSVNECANFLSISLRLILHNLNKGDRSEFAASLTPPLLRAWDSQSFGIGGTLKTADVATFNKSCLSPSLELIDALSKVEDGKVASRKQAIQAAKILIAKTTVLGLRERFRKRHLKQWRAQRRCLAWEDITPFLQDVRDQLQLVNDSTIIEHADILFGIAVDLIPKYDVRRKQQEQEWVDALLIALCYVSCPRLSQMSSNTQGEIEIIDAVNEYDTLDKPATLTKLFRVAATSPCLPSTQVTSYLAAAIAAWPAFDNPWSGIKSLLVINPEAFNMHTRVPTSDFAVPQLVLRVEHAVVNPRDFELLKSGIIIPMLRAFAGSRMLQDFIAIWRTQLQESMRVGLKQERAEIAAIHVWQDDDLFDELQKQAALSTSTTLSDTLLGELHTNLQDLSTRVGSSLDIFAIIAISTALLDDPQLARPAPPQFTTEIYQNVGFALLKRSDYQGQRWRLWKLLNSIQHHPSAEPLPEEFLTGNITQVSLAEAGKRFQTMQWYQECFERFKVLIEESQKAHESYQVAFNEELCHLEALLTSTLQGSERGSTNGSLWNGRSMNIHDSEQLLCACFGALLANPAVLSAQPRLSENLLLQLDIVRKRRFNSGPLISSLKALVEAAAKSSAEKSEKTLSKFLAALYNAESLSMGSENLSTYVDTLRYALGRLRPTYLRSIAERQFEHLKTVSSKAASLETAAAALGFLSWIANHTPVAYTRPEWWSDWRLISDRLAQVKVGNHPFEFLVISRAVDDIMKQIWHNATGSGSKGDADLRVMLRHAIESLRSTRSSESKVRLTKNLCVLHTTRLICLNEGVPQGLIPPSEVTELKDLMVRWIVSDLHVLASTEFSEESAARALIVLEVATEFAQVSVQKDELRTIAIHVKQAVSVATASKSIDSAILHKLQDLIARKCTVLATSLQTDEKSTRSDDGPSDRSADKLTLLRVGSSSQFDHRFWSDYARLASQATILIEGLEPESDQYVQHLELSTTSVNDRDQVAQQFECGAMLPKLTDGQLEQDQHIREILNNVAFLSGASSTLSIDFFLRLENANLALKLHPRSISQATIDHLLARICLLISGGGPTDKDDEIRPHLIIDRVCAVIGTLLSRFRRRLADRHHVLLPVLQQMMRYFFYSPEVDRRARQTSVTGSDPESLLRSLPAWLKGTTSLMPPSTVTSFSRLLASICNPTVSAAKSSRKAGTGSALNDETKRVKVLAGQHMQYLVMEYCRCTLDGDIAANVKEKLLPGLYTILDAMSRDLMRSMNANMDPSSRAIFKTLYDDWVKYGKWDKS